jgi:(S)-sulfolactate dehydrogenase
VPTVVITEFMDETAVDRIAAVAHTLYDPTLSAEPERIPALIGNARVLVVRHRTRVTAGLMDAAPTLTMIGRLGVGLDNIDMTAADTRRIAVFRATGTNEDSMAEYVLTTALMLLRGAYGATEQVMNGAWPRTRLLGREGAGKSLGLIGLGATARDTARRAQAFGMAVAAHDPHIDPDHPAWRGITRHETLQSLLPECDVVSLHVPLTEETRYLMDRAALSLMRPGAVLINAARGGVLDEAALAEDLRLGRIAGAALDVFECEPLTAEAGAVFRDCPNLIFTPHIAGVTVESNERVGRMVADAIIRHLEEMDA